MRLVLDARTASFATLIDYAGLFPPASLDMEEAVATYRKARSSDVRWVAGRFLCHASRLEELAEAMTHNFTEGEEPWEIGVIFDTESGQSASAAQDFHAEMQPAAIVASAEARMTTTTEDSVRVLVDAITSVQPDVVPFLEVNPSEPIDDQVQIIATVLDDRGRVGGTKLRCGGLSSSDFPDAETVASFIVAATNASLPFKATAGLHQPIRHFDEEHGVWRHGFVNILVAAAAAENGQPIETVTEIIAETDPRAFSVSTAFVTWRDIAIPGPAMRRTRSQGFVAYGSCDFFEPIEALQDLSFLGEGA